MKPLLMIVIAITISNFDCIETQLYSVPPWSFYRDQAAKIDEMQVQGTQLRKRICELNQDEIQDFNEEMHKCNQLNHIYRIDELFKPCRIFKNLSNINNYLEAEKQDCQYEECYLRVTNSPEYQNILQELDQMSSEERLNRDHERFKCAMRVLKIE